MTKFTAHGTGAFAAPSTSPDVAIEARGLCKVYGKNGKNGRAVSALDHIDLTVPQGSFFALLGPNGAGKSTFINILAGLVNKTAGQVRIWGIDIEDHPRRAKAAIGVVPQEIFIDPFFTPRESLELQAGMYGVPRKERFTDELLEALGLTDKADAFARTLSGGMKRRLLIAKAMVHRPPVLVLDEPTAGVDIELRQQLWHYVRDLNAAGTTIVLTTHYLEEAEALCDRVAIIDHGKVVACDTTAALMGRIEKKELILTIDRDLTRVPAALGAFNAELRDPRTLVVHYPSGRMRTGDILAAVSDSGLFIVDIRTEQADLEDIFLQLTSRK